MVSIADRMGLGPRRQLRAEPDGGATVFVTPPDFMGGKTVSVRLTAEQRDGFDRWRAGTAIQDALPDLSAEDREKLMSGLDQDAWDRAMGDDEDDADAEGEE